MALSRIGASSTASERARVSAAALVMATPSVPTAILAAEASSVRSTVWVVTPGSVA
jgi:hypothetical protein